MSVAIPGAPANSEWEAVAGIDTHTGSGSESEQYMPWLTHTPTQQPSGDGDCVKIVPAGYVDGEARAEAWKKNCLQRHPVENLMQLLEFDFVPESSLLSFSKSLLLAPSRKLVTENRIRIRVTKANCQAP